MAKPIKHRGKWRIRWNDENGKRRSAVFVKFAEANVGLAERQARAAAVKRGDARPAPPRDKTVGHLCDYWLDHRSPRKRSGKDDKSIIKNHLRPVIGEVLLRTLTAEQTDLVTSRMMRRGRSVKTIHNALTLLITMLTAARDELRWVDWVPKVKKPSITKVDKNYRWLRSTAEIARFLSAAMQEGEHVYMLYAAAIYSGLRAGELAGLTWDCIDFDRRLIRVSKSFSGPTKNTCTRYVPILDPLLPLLRQWRLRRHPKLVFTNREGNMLLPSGRIYQEVLHRVLKRAGFPEERRGKRVRRYVTFHDLRHTFASHWVGAGGDIFKLQRILDHSTTEMTMRYAHLAPDAFDGDLGLLGAVAPGHEGQVFRLPGQAVGG